MDDERQIIVGQSVTNQPPVAGNLAPMPVLVAADVRPYPDNASVKLHRAQAAKPGIEALRRNAPGSGTR